MPIGGYTMSQEIYDRAYGDYMRCAVHSSTFGGNSLACCTALETLERVDNPEFLGTVREMGEYLVDSLRTTIACSPVVCEVRGKGLLCGIDFTVVDHPQLLWENLGIPDFAGFNSAAYLIMKRLYGRKIVTQVCAHDWNTLKIEPPLIIKKEEIDQFVDAVGEAVEWLEGFC